MARLPEVLDRNALPEDKREAYDYLERTRGNVRLPFSVLLNAPEVAQRVAHVGTYVRWECSLPKQVVEIATLTAAREFDCGHEWAAHTRLAKEAGVSDQVIDVIGEKREPEGLPDEEAFVIRFGRQLLREHRVPDETFEEAKRRFGQQGVLDLTCAVGYYAMLACLINVIDIVPPPEVTQLPRV